MSLNSFQANWRYSQVRSRGRGRSHRVDSPQGHSVLDFSLLGSPTHTSVCHETKQSTTALCVSISRPLSLGSGCDVPGLGGNVSICISSHPPFFEGAIENGERDLLGHSDSSMLGKSPVLSSAVVSAGCWASDQTSLSAESSYPTHSRLTHPKPDIFNLHAWLCCREDSRKQDFLKDLPKESVPLKELPRSLSTITVWTLGWIGVSNGSWIPSIHL